MSARAKKHAPFARGYDDLLRFACRARHRPTRAEALFWSFVRQVDRHKPLGVKVRRQQVLCGYVVDFYIAKWKLVVEIDGRYHANEYQQSRDARRSDWLRQNGYRMIRFDNEQIETEIYHVLEELKRYGQG